MACNCCENLIYKHKILMAMFLAVLSLKIILECGIFSVKVDERLRTKLSYSASGATERPANLSTNFMSIG